MIYTLALIAIGETYLCGDCCHRPAPRDPRCICQRCGIVEVDTVSQPVESCPANGQKCSSEKSLPAIRVEGTVEEIRANCEQRGGFLELTYIVFRHSDGAALDRVTCVEKKSK